MPKLTEIQKRRRQDLRFIREADPLSQDEMDDIYGILRLHAGSLFVEKWHWIWVARLLRTVELHSGVRKVTK